MTAGSPRDDILTATLDVLLEEGLPWLSYDRIAAHAGTSRQRVRYWFPDQETLMISLCDQLADGYRARLTEGASKLEGPARIDFLLDFFFNPLPERLKPRDDRAFDALLALTARSPALREYLRGQYGLLAKVVSHETRIAYPELSLAAAEEIAYSFVALMHGHWKMVATLGLSEDHARITRAAMERLIASYRTGTRLSSPQVRLWSTES